MSDPRVAGKELSHSKQPAMVQEMVSSQTLYAGSRALGTAAAGVIVIAGLKAVASILIPVLVATILAVLSVPPVHALQRRGVPEWLAVIGVFLGVLISAALLSLVVGASISEFQANLPRYQERVGETMTLGWLWFEQQKMLSTDQLHQNLDAGAILGAFGGWLGALGTMLSSAFLVTLIFVFILAELAGFPAKLRAAIGDPVADLERFSVVVRDIQSYLRIKAQMSFATGLCVAILVTVMGIDYAVLWALLAFLLNFVPTIGSIVAAVPVVGLAALDLGWQQALVTLTVYMVINVSIGNIIEPRLMGKRLGLSSLVVFLSLIFWGWLWGAVGMFLAVPLTMVVKIWLENSNDLRWIAVLLGSGSEIRRNAVQGVSAK